VEGPPPDLTLEELWVRIETVVQRVHELESRVAELEQSRGEFRMALNRLGDALAATQDRPAMLSAVLETCALYLRASAGVFWAVVGGSDRLRPLGTCGKAPSSGDIGDLRVGTGVAGAAAAQDSVVVSPGSDGVGPTSPEPGLSPAVAVPVHSGNRPFGVLALYGRSIERPFSEDDVDALATLVRQVEPAIEATFLYEEATRLSITDGLTSLWNRRQFDLRLLAEHQRSVRFGEPFSVVLLDLDQMKQVNDTWGHQAGDALLIELAHRLASGVRDVDLVARFGGDEFALILPNTGIAGALRLAEKVRASIAERPFEVDEGISFRATVSVGVACCPEHGDSGKALVRSADAALYRAKAGGGNRVEHAKVEP
jgi:diguanylate cyclase (GGDEF)-like protein